MNLSCLEGPGQRGVEVGAGLGLFFNLANLFVGAGAGHTEVRRQEAPSSVDSGSF
jgi:hypothetical protein